MSPEAQHDGLRLTAPKHIRAESFAPDADQQRVLDLAPGHGPVLVLGGPGTGRSTLAVEYAVTDFDGETMLGHGDVLATASPAGADHATEFAKGTFANAGYFTVAVTKVEASR